MAKPNFGTLARGKTNILASWHLWMAEATDASLQGCCLRKTADNNLVSYATQCSRALNHCSIPKTFDEKDIFGCKYF
eukprot:scaffold5201_cov42-Cyclotella_meneghiniana.AAC.4